jgi:protein O-GlcNAc transferase
MEWLMKKIKKHHLKAISPSDVEINNLLQLYQTGRYDDAEKLAQLLTEKFSTHQFAWKVLGAVLGQTGRKSEAVNANQKSVQLMPQDAEAHSNLGITLQELGRFEEAAASYKKAIVLKPDYAEAHSNLGNALTELGRFEEAEASLRRAIALKPDYAEAHSNLGITLQELGRFEEAAASYKKAIALKPDFVKAHNNLGSALTEIGRFEEAEASLRQSIALKPDYAEAHNNLGNTLKELGRFEEAAASYKKAIALKSDFAEVHSNLLFLYSGFNYDASQYLKEAHDYGCKITEAVTSQFSSWLCEDRQVLRVGLVSGDLRNHPVGYFLEGLLKKFSRSKLALFAYPTKLLEDELSLRIKPHFSAWRPLVGISDEAAANLIHSDGINILIDLSGHTAKNGLPIFAWKPAPIQVTWLGYFASTGVAEIDYIVGDSYVTPVEEANHFTEKIWRLPESYLCFTQPNEDVDVVPLPALTNGSVTFGCFNKIERMSDKVVEVWGRILKAIPDSRLFLKGKTFSDDSMRDAIYRRFGLVGIGKERLILEGSSSRLKYLAAYNSVDIALAPFPYGGGTTSAEALWMGVPVIVKRGNHFLSHLGESIAHNAGLSNWIASDEDDYVTKAIEFSANLDDLAALRSRLRAQVVSSPLFDAERFANHFENALREMWERWKEGIYPNSIK